MRVTWYMSDTHACGYVRGEIMACELNRSFRGIDVVCKVAVQKSDFLRSDVMVFQRVSTLPMLEKILYAKDMGIRTVYELDDDILNTPPEFAKPYEVYRKPEVQSLIGRAMFECDACIVSTETLRAAVMDIGPGRPKYVVENALDAENWEGAYARRLAEERPDKITIGWMASGSHMMDAPMILGILKDLVRRDERIRLHLIGWAGFGELMGDMGTCQDRIRISPWVPIEYLPWAMADFDIGLAPLKDCAFNRAKSGIKAMQYWALGVPVVYSPLPPYQIVEPGLTGIPATNEADWRKALEALVADGEARRRMGTVGRMRLLEKYDIRKTAGQWVRVFEDVMKGD